MSRGSRRFAVIVLVCVATVTLAAMILLWPSPPATTGSASPNQVRVTADVLVVTETPCPGSTGSGATRVDRCGTVTLMLTDGPDRGRQVVAQIPVGPGAPVLARGDSVVLVHTPDAPSALEYQVVDHQRGQQMWLLALAAALVVIGFGRWRGLASLGGLAVTFAILLIFIVPAILDGASPLLVAIVGSAAIMLLVLYLTHGFNRATSVAVLGTLASLTLTGLLAAATTATLHLTGVATSEEGFLTATFQNVNMQGLLLAGILIGALGVLDDVAVTQAVTVEELAAANPATTTIGLYRAGSRVGRAHIASVVNTIVLAYAGASLPLLLLLSAGSQPLSQVLTTQMLAQEIVRSVVGTMGLVAAVPITTALAALAARGTRESAPRQMAEYPGSGAWAIVPSGRGASAGRPQGDPRPEEEGARHRRPDFMAHVDSGGSPNLWDE